VGVECGERDRERERVRKHINAGKE
jgi:hypothetical protein